MIYIYENGKRISKGTNIAFAYLNADNDVIAKSPDKQEVEGAVTAIEDVKDDTFNELVPLCNQTSKAYYHKLVSGEGKDISDYEKVWNIEELKTIKCSEIDDKTNLIGLIGFTFDNHIFATDADAKQNWVGIYTAKDYLTYPFAVTAKNNEQYFFQNSQEIANFYLTGINSIYQVISSGRELKTKVMECTTKECIDSIVDPR